ncbi:MAG: hypothetical protein IJH12_07700 [Clostridia bacterium]|nr:hypothetical protein [Clostridia bacterium]
MSRREEKREYNSGSNKIIFFLVIIVVGTLVFAGVKLDWFGLNKKNADHEAVQNKSTTETIKNTNEEEEIQLNNPDEDSEVLYSGVKKMDISDEAILNILIDTEPFDNGAELTTEQYLAIVYNALNEDYVVIDTNRRAHAGNGTATFSVDEINNIVYTLFGVVLRENADYGDVMKYSDGKYIVKYSDRGTSVPVAKDIEYDTAAGTKYINYELYLSEDGNEKYVGQYAIGKSNVSGVVTSKKKM